jgi:formylglycine-generating enzyme
MTIRQCIQACVASILLAGVLSGGWSMAIAADFDEQLRRVAREITRGAAKGRIHRLAVEPFADLECRVTRTGRLLAAELTTELAANRSVQVIDQRQLAARLEKREASLLSGLSPKELSQIGKELGLDGIVAGSVVESASQIRLTVKLIAVKNGNLVAAAKTTLPRSGLLAELAEPAVKPLPPLQKPDAPVAQNEGKQPPEGMALIPAGPFLYGEGDQQRAVTLPAFWIDLFEVTNSRYAKFRVREYDQIESHRPVTNVSWNQARQFCQSQGKRLPTEQEWEKAARGTDGRQYPWGNAYDPALVNAESRHSSPTDVGKFEEGRSPHGLYDMAGNAMEWTDSGEELVKTYRGGSWASPPEDVRATSGGSIAPAHRLPDLGFRCAMDGPR